VTGISAVAVETSHVGRAVVVLEALWGACGWDSVVAGQTVADCSGSGDVTGSHGSAGGWIAGGHTTLVHHRVWANVGRTGQSVCPVRRCFCP
jgi:hypothetical protein